jgi:hypothetical protein
MLPWLMCCLNSVSNFRQFFEEVRNFYEITLDFSRPLETCGSCKKQPFFSLVGKWCLLLSQAHLR